MKILGIEHIGIAVEDLATDSPFWRHVLGIPHTGTEDVETQGVTTDIYDTGQGKVELLEATGAESPIAKFIAKRGPGIHHICFSVDNIHAALEELRDAGVEVINDKPTRGAEGYWVAFIHPKSTGGVLVELAEKAEKGK